MTKKEKTSLYLLAIVAIVAIVGIVVLILNAGTGKMSYLSSGSNMNLAGQAGAPAAPYYCTDSDGGYVLTTKGTATVTLTADGSTIASNTDKCLTSTTLAEATCTLTNQVNVTNTTCKRGSMCYLGTCGRDSDKDGVHDSSDLCPGYDDTEDADGDGVPNDCDWPDFVITEINYVIINGTSVNGTNMTVNFTIKNQGTESRSDGWYFSNGITAEYTDMDGVARQSIETGITFLSTSSYYYDPYFDYSYLILYDLSEGTSITTTIKAYLDEDVVADIEAGNPHDITITLEINDEDLGYSNSIKESDTTNNQYTETVTVTCTDCIYITT